MIPKTIHYIWFGRGKKNKLIEECMKSWKKYCPDYEIKEWNEDNFDVNKYKFIKDAYDTKNWAFASDLARLIIVYENGGIYLDTDVEIIKNLDDLLSERAFFAVEDNGFIATGLAFGAEKGENIIKENIDEYNGIQFINDSSFLADNSCPYITTKLFEKYGFIFKDEVQIIKNVKIFPREYFCPKSQTTGAINATSNTYTIHHYNGSWLKSIDSYLKYKEFFFIRQYGNENGLKRYKKWYSHRKFFIHIKKYGFKATIKSVFKRIAKFFA